MFIGEAHAQSLFPAGGDLMSVLPIVVMIGLLYFLMIRPQMKRQKDHKAMLEALQKGDEVVAGGILGKVVEVGDTFVSVEIAKNAIIQVQKQSINTLLPKGTIKSAT
jgi:preprotein translocase subunit YajC